MYLTAQESSTGLIGQHQEDSFDQAGLCFKITTVKHVANCCHQAGGTGALTQRWINWKAAISALNVFSP